MTRKEHARECVSQSGKRAEETLSEQVIQLGVLGSLFSREGSKLRALRTLQKQGRSFGFVLLSLHAWFEHQAMAEHEVAVELAEAPRF